MDNPNSFDTKKRIALKQVGKVVSEQRKTKASSTIRAKIAKGEWHNSFARSRKEIYANESFDGKWEVHLAKWFDEHDVPWQRNKTSFEYVYDKVRRYTPDFYLPEIDSYVEVKGWKTAKDEAKWKCFPFKLIVLSGTDLQNLGIAISVKKDWKS